MEKEPTFDELIERLQLCSEINHPNRPWSAEAKAAISEAWSDKKDLLRQRVIELETKIIQG